MCLQSLECWELRRISRIPQVLLVLAHDLEPADCEYHDRPGGRIFKSFQLSSCSLPQSVAASYHHLLGHSFSGLNSAAMENINTRAVKVTSKVQPLVALVAVILLAEGYFSGVAANVGSCTSSSVSSLGVCLPAIEGNNPPSPTDACCAIVRATDTGCLCSLITEYSNSMGANVRAALLLPKQCKHFIPAGYTCDGYLITSYVPPHRKLMNA